MSDDKDRQEQAEQAIGQLLDGYSKLVAMATGAVGKKQKLRRLGGKPDTEQTRVASSDP
jgi:hypothetical protein